MKTGDRVTSTASLDVTRTHRGNVVAVERGTSKRGAWVLIDVRQDEDCCSFEGFVVKPRDRTTRSAAFLWEREK